MARRQPTSLRGEASAEALTPATPGTPVATYSSNGHYDAKALLVALKSLKKGDFGARLPIGEDGVGVAVAEAFNEVAELLEQSTQETARIATLVGKEGRITQR